LSMGLATFAIVSGLTIGLVTAGETLAPSVSTDASDIAVLLPAGTAPTSVYR
jgi:hypothetical protein